MENRNGLTEFESSLIELGKAVVELKSSSHKMLQSVREFSSGFEEVVRKAYLLSYGDHDCKFDLKTGEGHCDNPIHQEK